MRRPARAHPWLFMMTLGTGIAALVEGDFFSAVLCGILVVWTLR